MSKEGTNSSFFNIFICRLVHGCPTHFMISANPIASSTPGIAKARSCIIPPIIPLVSASHNSATLAQIGDIRGQRTLLNHLLQRAAGIDLHSIEVVKAVYARCVLGEFLTKRVGEIVGWVRRLCHYAAYRHELVKCTNCTYDKQYRFAVGSQLDSQ